MGTITPNSNIILLKGIPLDDTYTNTVYWSSASEQLSHFVNDEPWGSTKITISQHMYQRVSDGVLRVQMNYGSLYNCNYLLFQNQGSNEYATKWFYAFVTNVEYVNEQASNVYYEIDVMQTWFFEATLKESFVLREHPTTDTVGAHIETEPVDLGRIICDEDVSMSTFDMFTDLCACIAYAMPTVIPSDDSNENSEGE